MYMEITKEEALKRFNQLLKHKEELEERAERVFQILNWSTSVPLKRDDY